ncbi:MAG: putative transcriptional regulator [Verrucomicrobiales bacterium]|jgi:predicted transcriptional regulator
MARGRPPKDEAEKHVRRTITLPPELDAKLGAEAKRSGDKKSQIIQVALESELKRRGRT